MRYRVVKMSSTIRTKREPRAPGSGEVVDRLSRAYADRVDELNEMRERFDQIRGILMAYLEVPQAASLDLDDLKRVLELTEYGGTNRPGS